MLVARGLGHWRNQEMLVKGYKLSVVRRISSGNLMYNTVTVVKNPPCNAGDMGSVPSPEDFTHCGATKLVCHNY